MIGKAQRREAVKEKINLITEKNRTEDEEWDRLYDVATNKKETLKDRIAEIIGVARPVQKKEMRAQPKAMAAKDKEWGKLWGQAVWDSSVVRGWNEVARSARINDEEVHLGRLFGICVEKGSELPEGDANRKYKYRVVFQGNKVYDQNWEAAIFQDLGSAPATMEAARTCIMRGLLPGHVVQQADAMQAYVQAELRGTETWVELPEEGWPPEWVENGPPVERPCVRLVRALYGHPDSGTFWEKHADERLKRLGFEQVADSWASCYLHEESGMYLVLYVDDFLMSGPEEGMEEMWKKIAEEINIEDPGPMNLYLGCMHRELEITGKDGYIRRVMEFDQESFFKDKIEHYANNYKEACGCEPKFTKVSTPYLKESASENPARKPENLGSQAVECQWCKHAFALKESKALPETGGRIVECPWCSYAFMRKKAKGPTNLKGQISKSGGKSRENADQKLEEQLKKINEAPTMETKNQEHLPKKKGNKKKGPHKISSPETPIREDDESTNPDDERKSEISSKDTDDDLWNSIEEEDKIIAVFRDTDKLLVELGRQIRREEGKSEQLQGRNGNKVLTKGALRLRTNNTTYTSSDDELEFTNARIDAQGAENDGQSRMKDGRVLACRANELGRRRNKSESSESETKNIKQGRRRNEFESSESETKNVKQGQRRNELESSESETRNTKQGKRRNESESSESETENLERDRARNKSVSSKSETKKAEPKRRRNKSESSESENREGERLGGEETEKEGVAINKEHGYEHTDESNSQTTEETDNASIWSGFSKQKPGKKKTNLCVPAAAALMGLLYGARFARYDLLRPVQSLATFLHEWDRSCDEKLLRIMSYVKSTIHWRQYAWVGDTVENLGPHLYADADFAGCPRTLRSTSGYHLTIEGPRSSFPQTAASARQTALSNSTPEAEFAACHLAHKKAFLPALDLYDKIFPNGYRKIIHEDNQAMIQIAKSGVNKTMRWLSRNHGLAIRYLYDHLGNEETKDNTELLYTRSDMMAADIYTKVFSSKEKWEAACQLINIMPPEKLLDAIEFHRQNYETMQKDRVKHPNNTKPMSSNSATNRKYIREENDRKTGEKEKSELITIQKEAHTVAACSVKTVDDSLTSMNTCLWPKPRSGLSIVSYPKKFA